MANIIYNLSSKMITFAYFLLLASLSMDIRSSCYGRRWLSKIKSELWDKLLNAKRARWLNRIQRTYYVGRLTPLVFGIQ
ncbi:MAG: hypothetical protein ACTS73_02335 [Arsenophonus sp. NEOnobi-MAG3]